MPIYSRLIKPRLKRSRSKSAGREFHFTAVRYRKMRTSTYVIIVLCCPSNMYLILICNDCSLHLVAKTKSNSTLSFRLCYVGSNVRKAWKLSVKPDANYNCPYCNRHNKHFRISLSKMVFELNNYFLIFCHSIIVVQRSGSRPRKK